MSNFTTDAKICIERDVEVYNVYDNIDDVSSYFNIENTCKWIKSNNFEKVCLQFPDDLLGVSDKIYDEIRNRTDADLYILGDTSYASCCVDSVAAMHVQGDAIVHYGRSCFTKTDIPTYLVLPKRPFNIEAVLRVLKENIGDNKKLCLFYDAEYEHCKEELIRQWSEAFTNSYTAQIQIDDTPHKYLGRIFKDANGITQPVDVLKDCTCIYLGSRGQTLFSYTISIEASNWYLIDPNSNKLERVDETMWFKRRRFLIEKCKDANTVGILVCKLSGEQTKDIITRMKQLCKANGKKSYIVSVGKPNVAKLANFPEIDIYVMIACPENDLYSSRDFYKPIVYPYELELALNTNRAGYSTYHVTDFDELLPGRKYYCEINQAENTTDVSLITGRIRETKVDNLREGGSELVEKQNWALENIGSNLQDRSWKGLEQKLGETVVVAAEKGRKGIALQYTHETE